jgi:hypothetical protein
MSYNVSISANFHVSRTIPLSDICKNMMGHSMGEKFIMIDSLTLRSTDSSSGESIVLERGQIVIIDKSVQIPLSEEACRLATGAGEWSYLILKAVSPRKSNQPPICTELSISARFVLK